MTTSSDLFADVLASTDPLDRWRRLTGALASIGLDQVNYSFLSLETFDRLEARGAPFLSTMRSDWISYYTDRRYDMSDDIVEHVRAGRFDPKFYRLAAMPDFQFPGVMQQCAEAGLSAGLLVPLSGDFSTTLPTGGIVMGSSNPENDVAKIVQEHYGSLVALAHLFHTGMIGEMRRQRAGVRPLSARERDCLQYSAAGLRTMAIADRLGLADGTIELHLANARRKLDAKTLAEAVARAIQFDQIALA